jgi:CBS domain-containing protein
MADGRPHETLLVMNTTNGFTKGSLPRHRTVADVMTTHVHVASAQAPFKVLVRLIEENKVSAIPIVDHLGVPIGIVSEADLLLKERRQELESSADFLHIRKRHHERAKAEGTVASQLMTSPAITVPADTPLSKAAQMMQKKNIRRLVVVDPRGRIAGIVSRSNLVGRARPLMRGGVQASSRRPIL